MIVVKAFTKLYAIPGVRLGFLFCGGQNRTEQIFNQLPEWNISIIAEERAYLTAELEKLGIKVYPGEADFLLIKTDDPLYEKLLKKKILIRDCSNYRGLRTGYYRIAVKKHEENEKLIAQLKDTI